VLKQREKDDRTFNFQTWIKYDAINRLFAVEKEEKGNGEKNWMIVAGI
jgi:hypothetical protein